MNADGPPIPTHKQVCYITQRDFYSDQQGSLPGCGVSNALRLGICANKLSTHFPISQLW